MSKAVLRGECHKVLDTVPDEGLQEVLTALREFAWYYITRKEIVPSPLPQAYKVDGARFVGIIERPPLIIEDDCE